MNHILCILILAPFLALILSSSLCAQDLDTIWVSVDDSTYFEYYTTHGFIKKKQLNSDLSDGHYIVYDEKIVKRFLRKNIKTKRVLEQINIINNKYEGDYVKYTPGAKILHITSYKNGLKNGYETKYHIDSPLLLIGNRKLYENGELIKQENYDTPIKERTTFF